ncbi:hypothetical protein KIW84_020589 [Lathyrus oleraceus]|uniref:Uncharacterized protein n=1 Tax=Pisum sativum TaxID=3888 RepID=A0A9D4YB25_PEA|nr:hypothetical protein KIW84_020589 [Pisum sativum]
MARASRLENQDAIDTAIVVTLANPREARAGLKEANSISDPSVLGVGQNLIVPLPCTCVNGSDNALPAIYLSCVAT